MGPLRGPGLSVGSVFILVVNLASAEQCRDLRVGGAIALSGKHRTSGTACVRGWTLWAERANARGGIKLSRNRSCLVSLPLTFIDDESSSAVSQDLLRDMLDPASAQYAALDFVVGPFSSTITAGNALVAEEAKKILFSHGASESLYNRGNRYIFSTLTPGPSYMASGLALLWHRGARSIVFAHEAKSFSRSVCQGGNRTAHALGMQVLGYFEYPPGKTNFADIVYDIKEAGADVYVGCGHIDDITYLIGNANVLNVNPSAMLVTHASDEQIVRNVGVQNSHGVMSPTQWDRHLGFQDDDGFFGSAQDFNDDFAQRWGSAPSYPAAYAAAMGYALQKAIESAGSYETAAVQSALLTLNVQSFYGPLIFSGPSHPSGLLGTMPDRDMVTTQVHNGSIQVVAPITAASADLVYPLPTWSEKALLLNPCPLGTTEEGTDATGAPLCSACPAGTHRDQFSLLCTACPPGRFSENTGAAICGLCPAGTSSAASLGSTACVTCPEGTFCREGSAQPDPCPPGHYCQAGQLLPQPCPDGTSRRSQGGVDPTDCIDCAPGHYNDKAGMAECRPCERGRHTSKVGQRSCDECPLSSYQELPGQSNCSTCPETFVTHFAGANTPDACICKKGTYLDRRANLCKPCPAGALCPGGAAVPYVAEGFYAELDGDPDRPLGDVEAFSQLLVWSCPTPEHKYCPGEELPTLVGGVNGTAASARYPGVCPVHHRGLTCAWCEAGYWMDSGRCSPCGARSQPLVVMAVLLCAVVVALLLYKFGSQPVQKNFIGALLFSSTLGLALSFVQYAALLFVFARRTPPIFGFMSGNSGITRAILLDVPFMPPDCMVETSFLSSYIGRVAMPVLVVLVFFGNWFASQLLNKASRGYISSLSFDHSFNVCGMVLLSLYIGLCRVGLSYYECRSHEAAPDTLVAYPAVICGSADHEAAAPLGVFAVAVYMVGIFAVVGYINIIAPERYRTSLRFRELFRFLVVRWRPHKWYWGMVYMLRNVAITLVGICVPDDATLRCSLMLIFLVLGMVAQATHRPWRDDRSNFVDTLSTLCLCCLIMLEFNVVPPEPAREGRTLEVIEITIVLLLVLFLSTFLGILAYAAILARRGKGHAEAHLCVAQQLATMLVHLGRKLTRTDHEKLARALCTFPEVDYADIQRALKLLDGGASASNQQIDVQDSTRSRGSSVLLQWMHNPRASFRGSAQHVAVAESLKDVLGSSVQQPETDSK